MGDTVEQHDAGSPSIADAIAAALVRYRVPWARDPSISHPPTRTVAMRRRRRHRGRVAALAGACVALVTLVAVAGCSGDDDLGANPLAGREFRSQSVTGRAMVEGTAIVITFGAKELRATAGCNILSAPYSVRGSTLAVDAPGMGMTEMGCAAERHEQDDWLAGFLQGAPAFALDGSTLTLRAQSTVVELLDRRVADPDRPLVGTRWRVDTVIDGDAARSVGNAAPVLLELRDDGTLVATSVGCTSVTVSVARDGDVLRLGAATVDTIGCPDPWQPTIDLLRSRTVRFTVAATRLTLAAGRTGLGAAAVE
jgi:heat shock protein HslJ